jgi:hypothetical protein
MPDYVSILHAFLSLVTRISNVFMINRVVVSKLLFLPFDGSDYWRGSCRLA